MTQQEFLARILPPLPTPDPYGVNPVYFSIGIGRYPHQEACSSIDEVVSSCQHMSDRGADAYMGLCSFANPVMGRKAINASEVRCIWADIDVGKKNPDGTPKGKYATRPEALADLSTFISRTALVPSIVVRSGMGLHVYWCFDKCVNPQQWLQIAHLFRVLCFQQGLDVDPTRAQDLASVLRLPGTRHQKSGNIVDATEFSKVDWSPRAFVERVAASIDSRKPMLPAPAKSVSLPPPVAVPSAPDMADLLGMGPEEPTAKADVIAHNCAQIATMGVGTEPQWFGAMSVLRRCVDGLAWTHALSATDPVRYDPAQTEAKFYRAPEDAPYLCTTFENLNPAPCHSCQWRGLIKTPVQLSRHASVPPPAAAPAKPIAIKPPVMYLPVQPVQPVQIPTPPVLPVVPAPQIVASPESALGLILGHKPTLDIPDKWNFRHLPLVSPMFKVDHRGIVWMRTEKDPSTGMSHTVEDVMCTTQLYFKYTIWSTLEDMRPTRCYVFDAVHQNGKHEELRYIIDKDSGVNNIMRWFNNGGMFARNALVHTGALFMQFINAYLQSISNQALELETYDKFGWATHTDPNTKQKEKCFVTGVGAVTATGLRATAFEKMAKSLAADTFTKSGTLAEWKKVPMMYKVLKQFPGQLAVCMGFASALMPYGAGEARNCIYSLWSNQSGLGKTQVLRAAASIWGDPYNSFFTREESSVKRQRSLAVYNNIVGCMDEITDLPDEVMASLAYTLIGGVEKGKLKSSGEDIVATGKWSTTILTTANKPFKEALSRMYGDSDATLQRVMEYECEFDSYAHMPVVQAYIEECIEITRNNFGLAGPEFMFQLLQTPERLATLTKQVSHWVQKNDFPNAERFTSHGLGLALIAGRWAVEYGLLDYDMDALEEWVLREFVPHNRRNTAELAPDFAAHLTDFINQHTSSSLVVRADARGPDEREPMMADSYDKYIIQRPYRDNIVARFHQLEGEAFISKTDFLAWCKARKLSAQTVRKRLRAEGFDLQECQINMGKHISWLPTLRARCYKLTRAELDRLGYEFPAPPKPVPLAIPAPHMKGATQHE